MGLILSVHYLKEDNIWIALGVNGIKGYGATEEAAIKDCDEMIKQNLKNEVTTKLQQSITKSKTSR